MLKCNLEDFELDKTNDFDPSSQEVCFIAPQTTAPFHEPREVMYGYNLLRWRGVPPGDTQGAQNCELATILLGTLEVLIEVSVWELEEATTEAAIDGSMFSLQTLMAMHHRLGAILKDQEKKPGAKKPGAKKGGGGKRQKVAPAEEAATQHDGRPGPSATQREPAGGASTSGSSSCVRAPLLTARCLARLLHAVVMFRPLSFPAVSSAIRLRVSQALTLGLALTLTLTGREAHASHRWEGSCSARHATP